MGLVNISMILKELDGGMVYEITSSIFTYRWLSVIWAVFFSSLFCIYNSNLALLTEVEFRKCFPVTPDKIISNKYSVLQEVIHMLKFIVERGIHLQLLPVMKIWVQLILSKDGAMNVVCFSLCIVLFC